MDMDVHGFKAVTAETILEGEKGPYTRAYEEPYQGIMDKTLREVSCCQRLSSKSRHRMNGIQVFVAASGTMGHMSVNFLLLCFECEHYVAFVSGSTTTTTTTTFL